MTEFLSAQWFDELNQNLRTAGPITLDSGSPSFRVVLEFLDAPSGVAHTMTGRFDSATALREGRVKVRGDINAVVPLLSWLQLAHP